MDLFIYGGVDLGFRMVLLENEVDVRIKLDNLVVQKDGKDIWIPIDDISVLLIDSLKITLSARMLCALALHNVAVIFCDQDHLPIGYYAAYNTHSRASKMIRFQIHQSEKFYDDLWKEIVCAKIKNQTEVLERLQKREKSIQELKSFCSEVQSGDPNNREAHAAKVYFNTLMGTTFSRGNEDLVMNAGLDYGYTIIRSFLAKACVGYGLNTQLGIHHCNEYNRFNIVDDLIEPFRPIVDYYTYQLLDGEQYLKVEHRHSLVNLLNHQLRYKNKKMYISNVLEEFVANIAAYIAGRDVNIEYPSVINYMGEEDEI